MTEGALALVGVALGWALGTVTDYLRNRREERRGIGRALSHLLETRRQFLLLYRLTEPVLAQVSEKQREEYEAATKDALAAVAANRAQFGETVELLAGSHPMLAAEVRARGSFAGDRIIEQVRTRGGSVVGMSELRPVIDEALADLERLCVTLARSHGLLTWLRVRRIGRDGKPMTLWVPKEVLEGGPGGPTRA